MVAFAITVSRDLYVCSSPDAHDRIHVGPELRMLGLHQVCPTKDNSQSDVGRQPNRTSAVVYASTICAGRIERSERVASSSSFFGRVNSD